MQVIQSWREMRALTRQWQCSGESVGFVPTMGALHEGHLSLSRQAAADCDRVVASIFVNPLQFGPREDLSRYPRTFEHDCDVLGAAGCRVVFAPSVEEMYGNIDLARGTMTYVEVTQLGEMWEGVVRPGHLRGVATVVAKLFNIVQPDRAYFGEKDYQQLKVIQRMVYDLNLDIEIVPMPTIREADGLAMSSRNAYLSEPQRAASTTLYRAMQAAQELALQGEVDTVKLGAAAHRICDAEPLVKVQYIAIVDADSLKAIEKLDEHAARILIAAKVGETRLIDNLAIGA